MNYIKHTVAAHEHLRTRPEASPHHVALYWALFFAWNAEYFEGGIDLDHADLMQAAHIGSIKTYRNALRDLAAWGLLTYQPSKSKHHDSRCLLTDLSGAKVTQVKPTTEGKSDPDKKASPGSEVPQALRAEMTPVKPLPGSKMTQDTVLIQTFSQTTTTNVGGGTKKKGGEVFSGEGLSEVQVLNDTASFGEPVLAPGAAPKEKVARKRKGVGQGPPATPASTTARPSEARRRGGRHQRSELPFAESELATPEAFAAAFVGTDYALADLRYYHALVGNWRKDGEPPLRRDWKATATKFMLNDAADNRLKLAPGTQRHQSGANHPDPGARPTSSGYRSKYDA